MYYTRDMENTEDPTPRPASAAEIVGHVLGDLACNDHGVNRQAALRSERILEVIGLARRHPDLYTTDAGRDRCRQGRRPRSGC